jgi:peptidyl-prolyl cis-trans isomerase B (cyclophilin B)
LVVWKEEAMAVSGRPWVSALARWVLVGLLCFGLGCNRIPKPKADAEAAKPAKQEAKKPAPTQAWERTFAEATVAEPPSDAPQPPDETTSHKSVGKLYDEVKAKWDGVRLVTTEGKRLVYRATLDTEMGPIQIELHPEWAPNHVRNFVALAQAGYYDGLFFDLTPHQEDAEHPDSLLETVEAGSPAGGFEDAGGSIGYWLREEFNQQVHQEPGIVGACHGVDPNSAATRFYIITNCKKHTLDGNYTAFGKVTQGLDVARKIFGQPVVEAEDQPDGIGVPKKPVVIRKVQIDVKEVDKTGPGAEN